MSADRQSWLRRRNRHIVEEEPAVVIAEMESATQRLRDQAWKINATTRTPMISEEAVRSDAIAESER
jgi:hypothetical protein